MKNVLFVFTLLFASSFITACKKDDSPEGVLRSFVEYRFEDSQSRRELVSRTTGDLRNQIEEMTDQELEAFTEMSQYNLRRFRIERTKCSDSECFITYLLRYDQLDGERQTFSAEVRKIAELIEEDGTWKIADVKDVKTFFDSKEPIDTAQ